MAEYQLTAGGVVRNGAFIPNDPTNQGWIAYQEWLAGGGTPDAVYQPTLAEAQADAVRQIEEKAEDLRGSKITTRPGQAVFMEMRWREAEDASVDGQIDPGEYPLLEEEVGLNGVDVAAVATNVLAERTSIKTYFASIEAVRAQALYDIENAVDVAAVATALSTANAAWPSPAP